MSPLAAHRPSATNLQMTAHEPTESVRELVALHHRLHAVQTRLVTTPLPTDEIVRLVLELLDAVAPLLPAITRIAPALLDVLGQLDDVHDVTVLCSELTEAHRVLGNGLRDHDIEPGPPAVPVYDLLRPTLPSGDDVSGVSGIETGNRKQLPPSAG